MPRPAVVVWNTDTKAQVQRIAPSCGGVPLRGALSGTFDVGDTWLYIADTGNQRVVRMAPDGSTCQVIVSPSDVPGGGLGNTRYLAFGPDNRLYVSTSTRHVYEFDING